MFDPGQVALLGKRECQQNLFYSDSPNENPPLALQQIHNNTQMQAEQSRGYLLLTVHGCAAGICVDLPECHAGADSHFPSEVKDSMENLMKVTEFSPPESTSAHPPSSLHAVHGGLSPKAHHPSKVSTAALKLQQ